jgi:drug/metabolite transporter (DMT)-like permease
MTATALALVLAAAFMHAVWLGEGHRQPRLIGAILIAAGVGLIGLSG